MENILGPENGEVLVEDVVKAEEATVETVVVTEEVTEEVTETVEVEPRKGRGRPKGSKNKPKAETAE